MITEVRIDFTYTVNMGNMEFAKINMGVTKTVPNLSEDFAAIELDKLYTLLEKKVLQKADEKNP